MWKNIGKPQYQPCHQAIKTASGDALNVTAEFQCTFGFRDQIKSGTCYITPIKGLNLFGVDMFNAFNLGNVPLNTVCSQISSTPNRAPKDRQSTTAHTLDYIKIKYPAVFQDSLGLCKKFQVELQIKDGCIPIFRPKRPVAFAAVESSNVYSTKELLKLLNIRHGRLQ